MAGGGINPRPTGHAGRLRRRRSGRLEGRPCDFRTSSSNRSRTAAARCDSEETLQKPPLDSRSLIPDPYTPLGARREPILCRISHVQLGVPVRAGPSVVRSESEREDAVRGSRVRDRDHRIPPRARGLDRIAEPNSRVDCRTRSRPKCANRVASAMRFTERAAMVVRIVGEEAGDRMDPYVATPTRER